MVSPSLRAFEDYYLLFITCKVVIDATKCCVFDLWRYFLSVGTAVGTGKGVRYNQYQLSIMLFLENNFRNNVVLRVTLKSTILKISSIL